MLMNRPPLGWNTWNTFGDKISDQLIRESADAFVDIGLKKAGYEYMVVDDCWSKRTRDPETDRIVPEPSKFPNGMKSVADYVHSKGLKFGMYSCAGQRTCADYPGSFDHEFLDAETFASWGVDYLKYDFCYKPAGVEGPLLYRRMGMALRASGRDIVFSACNWGSDDVWSWIRQTGAHMYRSTGDIFDNPESFHNIFDSQYPKLATSAPQCFNDMDMLTVGMFGKGLVGTTGCNAADYRTQFALWCMCSCPLMLGCDIRAIDKDTLSLITNRDLIRIDQDEEARPPMVLRHSWYKGMRVLIKHLSDGTYAFMFANFGENAIEEPLTFSDFGLPASAGYDLLMRDVFDGSEQLCREYMNVSVPSNDVKVYIAKLVKR